MRTDMTAQLHLDGQCVGDVEIRGWHGPWGIGDFTPRAAFDRFAPLFAEWSRLMHADGARLRPETARRLRQIEYESYALRAALWIVPLRQWRAIDILNIDGTMIEWKEGWSASVEPPPPPAPATATTTPAATRHTPKPATATGTTTSTTPPATTAATRSIPSRSRRLDDSAFTESRNRATEPPEWFLG